MELKIITAMMMEIEMEITPLLVQKRAEISPLTISNLLS
jgi:hypothetical protein